MHEQRNIIRWILASSVLFACDPDTNVEPAESRVDADGNETLAVIAPELDATTQARVAEQLAMIGLDPENADACRAMGLLASVVDREGRYFAFCGQGTIIQAGITAAEPIVIDQDTTSLLETYLMVAPEGAPVPEALVTTEDDHALIHDRDLSAEPVIASAQDIVLTDLQAEGTVAEACASISSYCTTVADWADNWPYNHDWCITSPWTASQRTASVQLGVGSLHIGQGKQYVRACSGNSTDFEGWHKNPCTGAWDLTFDWNTGSGGFLHMVIGQRWHGSCGLYDTDLRFKTSGGSHLHTGAFGAAPPVE